MPVVFLEPSPHIPAKTKPKPKPKTKKQPGDSAGAALPANLNHVDTQNHDHLQVQTAKIATTATTSQLAGSTSKHAASSASAPLSVRVDTVKDNAVNSTASVLQGMTLLI